MTDLTNFNKQWCKEKDSISLRLSLIPKRILDLQFEIDQLKATYKELEKRHIEIITEEQKQRVEQLKNAKIVKREDLE